MVHNLQFGFHLSRTHDQNWLEAGAYRTCKTDLVTWFGPGRATIITSSELSWTRQKSYRMAPLIYFKYKFIPPTRYRFRKGAFLAVPNTCLLSAALFIDMKIINWTLIRTFTTKLINLRLHWMKVIKIWLIRELISRRICEWWCLETLCSAQ